MSPVGFSRRAMFHRSAGAALQEAAGFFFVVSFGQGDALFCAPMRENEQGAARGERPEGRIRFIKCCGAAAASLVHDGDGRPNALPHPF